MRKNQTNIDADAYLACKSDRFKMGCYEYLESEEDAIQYMKEWLLEEQGPWENSTLYKIINEGNTN